MLCRLLTFGHPRWSLHLAYRGKFHLGVQLLHLQSREESTRVVHAVLAPWWYWPVNLIQRRIMQQKTFQPEESRERMKRWLLKALSHWWLMLQQYREEKLVPVWLKCGSGPRTEQILRCHRRCWWGLMVILLEAGEMGFEWSYLVDNEEKLPPAVDVNMEIEMVCNESATWLGIFAGRMWGVPPDFG